MLLATQWGVSIEDILSQNDFRLSKLERKGRRRVSNQEDTEHTNHAQSRQQPFVGADTSVARPLSGSSQQVEPLAPADRGYTFLFLGPPVPGCADVAGALNKRGQPQQQILHDC
jgi:hypothetical protein